MFSNRFGLASLLKEGGRSFSGIDDVVAKNIDACRTLGNITRTSLGPCCLNKLIVNHIDKKFVTSDTATILQEMEIQHPAAKMVVYAVQMQEQEFGDATNIVLILASELLSQAENLLIRGLHTADVLKGYEAAGEKCLEYLKDCVCWRATKLDDVDEVQKAISTAVASKPLGGSEANLSRLIARAAVSVMPPNPTDFNVDNIRVAKMSGGSLSQSELINGMIITRDTNGVVKRKMNPKVMVLGCGLEMIGTEAKGTVLLHNADELKNFTKGEEKKMEETLKAIRDAGVEAIIVNGGAISDIAQHFCDRFDILVLKVQSKHDTRRLCRTLGAAARVRLGVPSPEEIGIAESISVEEISSRRVTIIRAKDVRVCTVLLRGSTKNVLDEAERAVDDAVNCVKSMSRDGRFVAGGGAAEIQVASDLMTFGATVSGLDQYAVLKFATALDAIPRILASSAGYNATDVVTALYAAHQSGGKYHGVCLSGPEPITDSLSAGVLDHYETKAWAINLAVEAVTTILRVDQIIMARPAGGPAPQDGPSRIGNAKLKSRAKGLDESEGSLSACLKAHVDDLISQWESGRDASVNQ